MMGHDKDLQAEVLEKLMDEMDGATISSLLKKDSPAKELNDSSVSMEGIGEAIGEGEGAISDIPDEQMEEGEAVLANIDEEGKEDSIEEDDDYIKSRVMQKLKRKKEMA